MTTEKLVDGDFLGRLLAGSYEATMGAVEEAVADHPQLFGSEDDAGVRVIGTYPDHALVVNRDGTFYRCEWTVEGDEVQLQNIKQIDVPVYEADVRASTVRKTVNEAVDAMLECDSDVAEEKLKELLTYVTNGIPMTAESVEFLFTENRERFQDAEWAQAVRDREAEFRSFLGAEALRLSYPKPRFEHLTGESIEESAAEQRKSDIVESIEGVREFLGRLAGQVTLARQVTEEYRVRGGSAEDGLATTDFVQFASSFAEDLDGMISIVEDALAVSEDGCAKCLARLHDGIAEQMREWAIAAAVAEKLARRFEAPKAA